MTASLTQFLIDVTRGPLKDAYACDSAAVVEAAALPEAWRRALLEQDVGALWQAGAHPMALLYFSRLAGWPMERYYDCISAASRPAAGPGDSARPAEPPPPQRHRSSAPHGR